MPISTGIKAFLTPANGPHSKHLKQVFYALYFYVVCGFITLHAYVLGQIPLLNTIIMLSCLLIAWTSFYCLIRWGWSEYFKDPSLALPHSVVGLTLNTLAYILAGPTRGNTLLLIAISVVAMMFSLNPQQIIGVSAYALVLLGIAMTALSVIDTQNYPVNIQLMHFILTASCLITMVLVAKSVSDIRMRLITRKGELQSALDRLEALATHDVLTGLVNRRQMETVLEQELRRGERGGGPFCIAVLDLDYFKIVNDVHGHRIGDEVLKNFAEIANTQLRGVDTLARWGGEEFVLLLPQTRLEEAFTGLERLRRYVAQQSLVPSIPDINVTFSYGVAQWAHNESKDRVIERADHALYSAKAKGRNCGIAAGPVSLDALFPQSPGHKEVA